MNEQMQRVALMQCRETAADAALKWAFVVMLLLVGLGILLPALATSYWEWKWRRQAKREGLKP